MRVSTRQLLCGLGLLSGLAGALPQPSGGTSRRFLKDRRYTKEEDGTTYTVFEHAATGASMSFVTNSGVCETTPGVNQYSGYLSVGSNENMWFWFFESRNSPTTAPLAMWLNGGPGCSSMIGLFQENGPCHFLPGGSTTTPTLNPYSWNTVANMLYVDQPIGTGFSYGTDTVTSTVTAAPQVWALLQAFFAQFPQYESRDFGLFTESYGGHYGPEFAEYFEDQNSAIAAGTVTGEKIDLVALGINNGWIDPKLSYKGYIDYAANNTYRKLISASQYTSYMSTYNSKCVPALAKCTGTTGTNSACVSADNTCYNDIEGPLFNAADFDVYDIREPSNDPYPPETYNTWLQQSSIQTKIGAKVTYGECSGGQGFDTTGDDSRTFLPALSTVVQSGIRVLIWAGDADFICNYMGNFATVNAITYSGQTQFVATALKPYTVSGTSYGLYKTVDNLAWLQVYAAGHEIPYYQPQVALQAFNQTIHKLPLSST